MKFKSILKVFVFGVSIGFIFGLVSAIQLISSHKYLHYRMFRLILFNLTERINVGIIYGLIITTLFILLLFIISFIWRKLFSPFFKVRITKIKKLTPLAKGFSFSLILAYLLFFIFKFALSPEHNAKFLLGHSLVVLCLFLIFLRIEKAGSQLANSEIFKFAKSYGINILAGVVVSIFILINLFSFSQKLFNSPSGPNVLLIIADALRPDHLGCYGYNRATSPQIDKFAADSLIFENAWSNSPWTKPTMGTLFTSLYPTEHQAFYWTDDLSDKNLSLPEVFRNKNYATYAIQTNPCITETHNFKQGFKYYEEMVLEKAEIVTAHFNSWVKKHKKKPFFAYLHYMDTHSPYNAPREFSEIFGIKNNTPLNPGEFKTLDIRILNEIGLSQGDKNQLVSLYDGAIKYFDYNFKKIIDNLEKLGILDNTIIILTSDHGEEFWEHGGFAHGHTLYNELLHIPLIIRYSSHLPAKHIKPHVQLLDLFPTILSMARINNDFELRGNDLIPPILNNRDFNEEIFFEGLLDGAEKKGILKENWKLIENTGERNDDTFEILGELMKYLYPEYKKSLELYNLDQDIQEKNNLINKYPNITIKLKARLRLFRIELSSYQQTKKVNLKKKLEDLKSLGYVK